MNKSNINSIKKKLIDASTVGLSMQHRLLFFLVFLVITMSLGIVIVLFITGTFTAGLTESKRMINTEMLNTSKDISRQYTKLSAQAQEFSTVLSKNIESHLTKYQITSDNLDDYPDIIEELVSSQYELSLYALQKTNSSGVYFILNTTVNSSLINAETSKTGLYIKNMEPNIINATSPSYTLLRGFPSIGRNNSLSLHAQWSMEFDVSDAPYYTFPMEAAKNMGAGTPLSYLYYWSPPQYLPNTNEEVMLCSVPLIDSNDNIYGVCGFEISTMLFKLTYMPYNNHYNRMFFMLSPLSNNTIEIPQSMLSGSFSARNLAKRSSTLSISDKRNSFTSYCQDNQVIFLGFHKLIQLYPKGSAFSDNTWITATLVPKADIIKSVNKLYLLIIILLSALVFIGVLISYIISKNYLKPFSQGIEMIKFSELNKITKTKVIEIDDLVHYLSLYKDEMKQMPAKEKQNLSFLELFIENTKSLSPAERSVFHYYVQGYTAKEIAEILFLSINTIKTHSKRIYTKLNVATREELLLYINMLKEIGQEFK